MSGFMEFNSMEEAFAAMPEGTERANAVPSPAQTQITWGDYWVRFWGVPIFGYIETRDDLALSEYGKNPDEERIAEADYTMARMIENHDRGYMFGKAYSVIE